MERVATVLLFSSVLGWASTHVLWFGPSATACNVLLTAPKKRMILAVPPLVNLFFIF